MLEKPQGAARQLTVMRRDSALRGRRRPRGSEEGAGGVTLSDVARQPARVKRRSTQRGNARQLGNAKNGRFKPLRAHIPHKGSVLIALDGG